MSQFTFNNNIVGDSLLKNVFRDDTQGHAVILSK